MSRSMSQCSANAPIRRWKITLPGLILLLLAQAAMAEITFEVSGFNIAGDNPLGERATERVLAPFIGPHTGIERLRGAADTLEKALNRRGFDFHRVTLPPQVLESGEVTLEIRRLVVGDVTTSGNHHFSDANLRRSLPQLQEGETPNTHALSRALAVANFNTAKRTRLIFGRGETADTLDARIEAIDRNPQQLFTWLNNTGNEETTYSRLGVGYQHLNLFDRDHAFTATYTTSPEEPDKVHQFGLNYQLPLYRAASTLALFHVDSDVDSGIVADVFDVGGSGTASGVRYSQVLNKLGSLRQRLYLDLADKLFDNQVNFLGTDIGTDVRSRPLSATWQLEWDDFGGTGRFNLTYSHNLNGGSLNTDAAYAASRLGASQGWDAWRLNVGQDFIVPRNWRLALSLEAQYADEPLISGEQLGLGGSTGPRGFQERAVSVDRGGNLRTQFWAPPLANDLQFGVFVDYGFGSLVGLPPGQEDSVDLTSTGVSAKWQWKESLVAYIDFGHVLSGFDDIPELTQDGDNRVHASLVYRFQRE